MAGNRGDDWGKEKKFKEGQAEQVLDTLFFDFIDLAKELQPKIVVAENVKGLLLGEARNYVRRILKEFNEAGYYVVYNLLDASKMGIPQKRERVFFTAIRKDLASNLMRQVDMFKIEPYLKLEFIEKEIPFKIIEDLNAKEERLSPAISKYWYLTKEGDSFSVAHPKGSMFNYQKANRDKVLPTITAHQDGGSYHPTIHRRLSKIENCLAGSYPLDYNFLTMPHKYLIGMSVPPLMTARLANELYNQWLTKI